MPGKHGNVKTKASCSCKHLTAK